MSKKICMVLVFLLTMAGMLSAQTRTVKGNVVFSEDGQPGPVFKKLYEKFRNIQYGLEPDVHGWVTVIE